MKKLFTTVLGVTLLPIYATSYGLAKAFNLDKENEMPTIKSWLGMSKN